MDMVSLNIQFFDVPVMDFSALVEQRFQVAGYFTSQDALTVLWYPDEMIFQSVLRMRTGPVSILHAFSMPEQPPFSNLRLLHSGQGFIPRLESLGDSPKHNKFRPRYFSL